jgi:hypothetical protein
MRNEVRTGFISATLLIVKLLATPLTLYARVAQFSGDKWG